MMHGRDLCSDKIRLEVQCGQDVDSVQIFAVTLIVRGTVHDVSRECDEQVQGAEPYLL